MVVAWRAVGINYVRYSNICAKVLRKALKPDAKAEAEKRSISHVICRIWINGSPQSRPGDAG